jgi:RND family efflux transporter MFP subunit
MQMPVALPRRLPKLSRVSRLPTPNRWVWLAAVALLVVLGVIGYLRWSTPTVVPVQGQQVPIRRGSITQTVSTSGTTVSTRQVKLNFAAGGKIKDVYVKLGDKLTVGQPIAALDTAPFELKVENAQSSVRQAQIKVQQLRDGATAEEVAASQAAFEAAQTKFQEVANGPTAADIQAARSSLESAIANQTSAQAKLDALMAGPKADEAAAATSSLESARVSLDTAEAKLADLKAGPKADELAAAASSVVSAREGLSSARAKLDLLTNGGTGADAAAAQASVVAAQASLDSATKKLEDLKKVEPVDVRNARASLESARASVKSAEAKVKADKNADDATKPSSAQIKADEANLDAAKLKVKASEGELAQVLAGPKPGDLSSAEGAVVQAKGALQSAVAKLNQLRNPDPRDVLQARSAVTTAEASLRSAETKLAVLQAGPTQPDLVAAQGAVDSARMSYEAAQAKVEVLLGGPLETDVRSARASLESARSGVTSAQAKLDDLQAGAKPSELQSAQSSLAQAQSNLANTTKGAKETDLLVAMEQVKIAELNLKQAQLDLQDATLTSPINGVVAAINGNPGEVVGSGATNQTQTGTSTSIFVTLVDPSAVRVDANVDEVDVAKLSVGKPAEVTFDALPDRRFRGQVGAVSPSGSSTSGVVTYPIAINLQIPDDVTLPSGMTASVVVTINRKTDVIVVPTRAVRRQGREQVVEVVTPTGTEMRQVQIGMTNDQQTEIVSGISEGETAIVPGTGTAPVRTGGGGGQFGGGLPGSGGGGFAPKPGGR